MLLKVLATGELVITADKRVGVSITQAGIPSSDQLFNYYMETVTRSVFYMAKDSKACKSCNCTVHIAVKNTLF